LTLAEKKKERRRGEAISEEKGKVQGFHKRERSERGETLLRKKLLETYDKGKKKKV